MDPTYTMSSHVSHLVQVVFLKLRKLSYFRRYLTDESTKNGSSCLYNLPIGLLQQSTVWYPPRTDNENAKFYECCSSTYHKPRTFDHITPVLRDLHWLPVSYRCQFKLSLLVFKCIHKLAPTYLCKRLTLKLKRGLRSDNKIILDIPLTQLKLKNLRRSFILYCRTYSVESVTQWLQVVSIYVYL